MSSDGLQELLAQISQLQQTLHKQIMQNDQAIFNMLQDVQKKTRYHVGAGLSTFAQHQRVFPQYKNAYAGREAVLIATGPSLNRYQPISGAVHVGVNAAFKYDKVDFDALFIQDYNTKGYLEDFCAHPAKKFLGLLWDTPWDGVPIPESIALRHGIERYYVGNLDELPGPTFDISALMFWEGLSIAFSAMQFLFWTNPKRIYLVGCDGTSGKHFDGATNALLQADKVLEGWHKIKKFGEIYYPETEIVSVNPEKLRGLFTDLEQ